ncbi:MAG: nitroreductase [Erysipelotrichaceae bacterium]|nr:nitroreductase [Erysipelotrichaceae bacterium]
MITTRQAIMERHSVRAYREDVIEQSLRDQLDEEALQCSRESGLTFRIVYDDERGFDSALAHYGRFRNVRNYIMIAFRGNGDADEKSGYYGERLVILAQKLGLNTCWAALTFNRKEVRKHLEKDEKLIIVISLGYGADQGHQHRNKDITKLAQIRDDDPQWYRDGIEAALQAPTAVNQQKFRISRQDDAVSIVPDGRGQLVKLDLGIVKYNFEAGAGRENFHWADPAV